ncbi:MAG: HepT-like ribonuclease domain-containing protein [Thermoleophilia bacterium]
MGLLEIVGEAAKNVSPELSALHPEVSWGEMAGTRDRLIHGYFSVVLEVVWAIVAVDLPVLLEQLRGILAGADAETGE